MAHHWKITRDIGFDTDPAMNEKIGIKSRVGLEAGDKSVPMTQKWRTKDSDGYVSYYGEYGGDGDGFEPLDFCQADVGDVTIEYLEEFYSKEGVLTGFNWTEL